MTMVRVTTTTAPSSGRARKVGTGLPFPLAAAIDDHSVYVTLALGPKGPVEVALLTNGGGEENGDEDHRNGDHGNDDHGSGGREGD